MCHIFYLPKSTDVNARTYCNANGYFVLPSYAHNCVSSPCKKSRHLANNWLVGVCQHSGEILARETKLITLVICCLLLLTSVLPLKNSSYSSNGFIIQMVADRYLRIFFSTHFEVYVFIFPTFCLTYSTPTNFAIINLHLPWSLNISRKATTSTNAFYP